MSMFGGGRLWGGRGFVQLFRRRSSLFRSGAAVCSSSQRHNYSTDIDLHKSTPDRVPWLVFFPSRRHSGPTKSPYLFSLSDQKKHHISLPNLSLRYGKNYVGSSQGYLIYLDDDVENKNLHATNPITGAHLAVPPTATLSNILPNDEDTVDPYGITFVLPDGRAYVDGIHEYYEKAILSSSMDSVVILHARSQCLSFARIGDNSWTDVISSEPTMYDYSDMIFHKGRLHAVDNKGNLAIFDLDRPLDRSYTYYIDYKFATSTLYDYAKLVESPEGKDLFLVLVNMHDSKTRGQILDGTTLKKILTKDIEVFVLDKTTNKWNPMEDLGDITIFIGSKCSMSLHDREFSGLRRNCVYFFDDYYFYDNRDLAIYNLEDGSFQRIYSDHDSEAAIWFVPALS